MGNSYKIIAIDESGKASFKHPSPEFLLSGLVISEKLLKKFDSDIKNIKKKFFKNPDIVFHCRDMLRKKGKFSILLDPDIEEKFWNEFIKIISISEISIIMTITDKNKARKIGWNDIAILKKSYAKVIENFTKSYLVNGKGKIIAESDPYQDRYLLETHNRLQSIGLPSEGLSGFDYRNKMTSISLVNKLNFDSSIQTADNLAIMGRIFYNLKIRNVNIKKLSKTELRFKKLIDQKLSNSNNPSIFEILV
ncbi:MAG: hypothetical protein WCS41_03085 [Candidatus Paceibacterota bacterium]